MTHYDMRYEKRKLSEDEARAFFEKAPYCIVSTVDEDGAPYGVPLSFVFADNTIYVHTTNTFGHKLDDFKHDPRVCATVVGEANPCFEATFFTTRYESAMAFGKIREVPVGPEFRRALVELCMKYVPEAKKEIGPAIEREISETGVWAIDIDELSAKAARKIGDWNPASESPEQ